MKTLFVVAIAILIVSIFPYFHNYNIVLGYIDTGIGLDLDPEEQQEYINEQTERQQAQEQQKDTPSMKEALGVTKLSGDEKLEIVANDIVIIGYPAPENYYDLETKPIIKIDGQTLEYQYPVDTNDNAIVEDTLVSISMTAKAKLSETETKVLEIGLYSNPDIITDNPDGSKTYTNKPYNTIDNIRIGDVFYYNVKSTATINADGTRGFIKAEAN